MKKLITVIILCAAAMSATEPADKKSEPKAAAPKAITIPKDATKNADGTYSYSDKDGRKWVYKNTPFGVMKSEIKDTADQPARSQAVGPTTKVIDKGDTVRFERPSPFGTMGWEKKKSELTEEERKLLDAQSQSQPTRPDAK